MTACNSQGGHISLVSASWHCSFLLVVSSKNVVPTNVAGSAQPWLKVMRSLIKKMKTVPYHFDSKQLCWILEHSWPTCSWHSMLLCLRKNLVSRSTRKYCVHKSSQLELLTNIWKYVRYGGTRLEMSQETFCHKPIWGNSIWSDTGRVMSCLQISTCTR